MKDLNIMHIDMDAFFAAVEQLDNPDLKGKPVIVGGTLLDERGVVSTASYEARKYGVHSAMPLVKAKRLCPEGIFLSGRHGRYQEVSNEIFKIFSRFTPLIEKVSIDEAFLDLTGCHRLFGSSEEIGREIKNLIKKEIGLIASVGIAPNKFLAKLASDMKKPDGFFVIRSEKIRKILDPLPVGKIWGVGKKTEKVLNDRGIKNIAKLKELSKNDLINLLGTLGENLYYLSRGIDNRSVIVQDETKSISNEKTFRKNLTDEDQIFSALLAMSEHVTRRLRQKGLKGSTVFIKVRYDDFTTYTRRITCEKKFCDSDTVFRLGRKLIKDNNLLKRSIRLLGVGVGNLNRSGNKQLSLFNKEDNLKGEDLINTIDAIKDRFGNDSIQRAKNLIFKNKKN